MVKQNALQEVLATFYPKMEEALAHRLVWRLGFKKVPVEEAGRFANQFFQAAKASHYGWDALFQDLYAGYLSSDDKRWKKQPELAGLLDVVSKMVPRQSQEIANRLKSDPLVSLEISVVENAWEAIATLDDWSRLHALIDRIRAHGILLRKE